MKEDNAKSFKQKFGKLVRVILVLFGIFMLLIGLVVIAAAWEDMNNKEDQNEALVWFDPFEESEVKQYVEFEMISYPFASFELSDAQGLYFVFDEEMCPYIVCMDNDRLETEFKAIYEYTFSDVDTAPVIGEIQGYVMPIDEELKKIAIEEFNYLWDEEIINTGNFEEYFGSYYLDSTYIPGTDEESPIGGIFGGIFFCAIAVYLIYYAIIGQTKKENSISKAANISAEEKGEEPAIMLEDGQALQGVDPELVQQNNSSMAGELPVSRNIVLSLLATVIGAALGGILWIFFYKMGRIVAVAGYVSVMSAIWGWTSFGKRELKAPAAIWCIFISVAMIFAANYISYAWEILDALNANSQNRAEFFKVLVNMPQLMTDWELWGSFIADLSIGLILAVVAGLGGLFKKKKQVITRGE